MQQEQINKAMIAGFETLCSEDIRVKASSIEDLANFKELLRAILSGQLVLASPDRIKDEETPDEGED